MMLFEGLVPCKRYKVVPARIGVGSSFWKIALRGIFPGHAPYKPFPSPSLASITGGYVAPGKLGKALIVNLSTFLFLSQAHSLSVNLAFNCVLIRPMIMLSVP